MISVFLSKLFVELSLIFYLFLPALVKNFELIYLYLLNFLNLSVLESMIYVVFLYNIEIISSWCNEFPLNSMSILDIVSGLLSGLHGHKFSSGLGRGL